MSDAFADACRVLVGPEEIVVDFGRTRPVEPGGDVTVALSQRIVMPPRAAFGLISALVESLGPLEGGGSAPLREAEAIRAHGASLAPLASEPAPATPAQAADLEARLHPTRSLESSRAEPASAAEAAARVFRQVDALGVGYAHERSFRLRRGALASNRFLLSVGRRALGAGAVPRVLEIAHALGMPRALLERAAVEAPAARCVHFGFEEDAGGCLYKLYLESGPALEAGRTAAPGAPSLRLHLAFKWAAAGQAPPVVTEYHWHPALSVPEILDRIAARGGADEEPLRVAGEVLRLAAARMPEREIQYLEVVEENGRRSYDLNFYDAGLRLRDVQPLLGRLRRHYGVPAGRFQALYDQVRASAFGHLAGGVHRNREDFSTVYYGVEGRPRRER